jgi:hypothetical protein
MKQETLKEAAEKYAEIYRCPATNENEYCRHDIISAINFGAKWQQEQDKKMYSEENLKEAYRVGFNVGYNDAESPSYLKFEEWFEQFKNK